MGTIKAVCIKQYKILKGILEIDDEVEIVSILSTEEKVIVNEWWLPIDPNKPISSEKYLAAPAVIAPIGSYEGFTFLAKDGKTYSDKSLHNAIGYFKMENLFKKM